MPKNKNSYWAERARKDKLKVIKTGEKGIDNLKRLLLLNIKDVEKQIKDFYEQYGENPAEELSNKNWQRYKKRLRDMAKANPQDKTLQKLAKQNIPKYKIDRLRALELDLQMQLTEATNGQAKGIYNTLDDVSKVSQATLASRMDKTLGLTFNAISANKMKQILMSDWSGANWSERLWKDREKVGKKLTDVLQKGIPQGVSLQKMSRELRDLTGESFNNAFRLIRTETSHIDGQVTLEGYRQASEELGLQYYEYDAFLDSRTSSFCRELDGKRFKITDAEVGVNYPPRHPNCRSTTQLVLDEDYKQEESRSKNPNNSKEETKAKNNAVVKENLTVQNAKKALEKHAYKIDLPNINNAGNLYIVDKTLTKLKKKYPLKDKYLYDIKERVDKDSLMASAGVNTLSLNPQFINNPKISFDNAVVNFVSNKKEQLERDEKWLSYWQKMGIAKEIKKYKSKVKLDKELLKYKRHNVLYEDRIIESCITHEYGHLLTPHTFDSKHKDFNHDKYLLVLDAYSKAKQTKDIYKISAYASNYTTDGLDEFFAECFAMRELGIEKVPNYIDNMITEVLK